MAEKILNSRIVQKHDIAENWEKAVNFIPKQGEIIIYDSDSTYTIARFKIGDGTTKVNNLPFVYEPVDKNDIDAICGQTLVSVSEVSW